LEKPTEFLPPAVVEVAAAAGGRAACCAPSSRESGGSGMSGARVGMRMAEPRETGATAWMGGPAADGAAPRVGERGPVAVPPPVEEEAKVDEEAWGSSGSRPPRCISSCMASTRLLKNSCASCCA
jgi:hypothetical protein